MVREIKVVYGPNDKYWVHTDNTFEIVEASANRPIDERVENLVMVKAAVNWMRKYAKDEFKLTREPV